MDPMNFILAVAAFVLGLFVVKISAEIAYKAKVSWGQAFVQAVLLYIIGLIVDFLFFGSTIGTGFLGKIF